MEHNRKTIRPPTLNAIISANTRIRNSEYFAVGQNSIIDDFCYFSTKVKIGFSCHIASCCTIAGGLRFTFDLGDYSSLSSGVKIWCSSNNFANDLIIIQPPNLNLINAHSIEGNVSIGPYSGVGANTVIMPGNVIPEGTVIGALSFVPHEYSFKPWSVYAGAPIQLIGSRNLRNVLRQVAQLNIYFGRG
jgi:acetyltransferase-like isoleucine patch superfamily enzyme